MFTSKSIAHLSARSLTVLLLGLVLAAVNGCSSSDNSAASNGSTDGTGTIALLLTDAPSELFEEINITVVKAELLSDNAAVTIFEGEDTFNLLDLTDAEIFAIRENIPAGIYSKIRLTLSSIELVDYMDSDDPADDQVFYPTLPGNGKLDLNPRGEFAVVAGETLAVQIDMDANKSIHIVKKGKKDEYNFRPVVFVDIMSDDFAERFVQLHGIVDAIDTGDQSFNLCDTDIPVKFSEDDDSDTGGCLRVETDADTAIFDINGMPTTFGALVEGEPATVFGRLHSDADNDDAIDESLDFDDDRELNDMVLKAAMIELGPETVFRELSGTATSAVGLNNQFTMDVEPGQGLVTPLNLKVQLQPGTLLVNLKSEPVDIADIVSGKLVNARGVLDVVNDTLFASIIVVDTDNSSSISGTVGANPDLSCGFTLMTGEGDRSVSTDADTDVFLITDSSSSPIGVGDLVAGQQADAYGNYVGGCFDAHTIIAY